MKPVFQQTYNLTAGVFDGLWQFTKGVFTAMSSLFGSFGSVTLGGFVQSMVTGLATIEFGFRNWRTFSSLEIKTLGYRMVQFGNSVVHLFTQEIPYAFGWFRDHGLEIAMNLTANVQQLFENLGANIASVFTNLPGLISGSVDLGELLTPLSDGMLQVVNHAIELPKRTEGAVESLLRRDLESLQNELSNGLSDHISNRLAELIPDRSDQAEVKPPVVPEIKPPEIVSGDDLAGGQQTQQQFAALAEAGSQEYRDAILRFRGIGEESEDVAKEQRDIAKKQLAAQEEANKLLAKQKPQPVFSIPGG